VKRYSEIWWLVGLLALTLFLRFYDLGARPYDHDEAIHGWFSVNILNGNQYRFDPVYHGPLLYYANALVFKLLGASDFYARFLPALSSTALVLLCFAMKRELGRYGWIFASSFMALSPSLTYYGRFLAHDDFVLFFTLAMVVLAVWLFRTRNSLFIYLLSLVMGLFICTKACFYIHSAIFVSFLLLSLFMDSFHPAHPRDEVLERLKGIVAANRIHVVLASLLFVGIYCLFYSSFFANPYGVVQGVTGMLTYWGGQQANPRLPGPLYYYIPRLIFHEPAVYLAVPALIYVGLKKVKPMDTFLAFWTVCAFVIYSFAQEKVPWLVVHMVLPLAILAGRFTQTLWQRINARRIVALVLVLVMSWSLRENIWLCFDCPSLSPHLLKYMSTTKAAKETALEFRKIDPKRGQIFVTGDAMWVFTWYLRDREVTYLLPRGWQKTAIAVVADEKLLEGSEGFVRQVKDLRWWWLPDYRKLMTRDFFRYLIHHESTDPVGIARFSVYYR